jgi:tetratricopeptide (TPR) repeat protein
MSGGGTRLLEGSGSGSGSGNNNNTNSRTLTSSSSSSGTASQLFREASAQYANGQLDEADATLVKALRSNPSHVKSLILKGVIHNARQRYDKAIEKFDMALRLQPQNGLAFGNRGIARRNKGLTRDALADFDRALDILGSDVSFLKQRAICHRILQQYHAALADYNLAISLSPNNAELLYQRSRVYMRIDDHESRLSDLVDALKIEPDNKSYRSAFVEASTALDEPTIGSVSSFDLSVVQQHHQQSSQRRGSASSSRFTAGSDSPQFASTELVVVSPRKPHAEPLGAISYAKRIELPSPRHEFAGGHHHQAGDDDDPSSDDEQPVAVRVPTARRELPPTQRAVSSKSRGPLENSDGDPDNGARSLSRSGSARDDPYNEPLPPLPIGENYPASNCNTVTLGSLSPRTMGDTQLTPRNTDSSEEYAHLPATSLTLGSGTVELLRSSLPARKNKLVAVAADEAISNAEYDLMAGGTPVAPPAVSASTLVAVKPDVSTTNDEYDRLVASASVRRASQPPPKSSLVSVQSLAPTTDDEYAVLIQKR